MRGNRRSRSPPITGSVERRVQRVVVKWACCNTGFSGRRRLEKYFLSFAGDFASEAGECDGEGLHGTHRVVEVQREDVVGDAAKLHHDVVHWKKKKRKGMI